MIHSKVETVKFFQDNFIIFLLFLIFLDFSMMFELNQMKMESVNSEMNHRKTSYKLQGKLKSSKTSMGVSAKVTDYRKVNISMNFWWNNWIWLLVNFLKMNIFQNTKPLMEKRRRERINRSLEELKDIILDQTNHNVSWTGCFRIGGLILTRIDNGIYFNDNSSSWIQASMERLKLKWKIVYIF